MEGTSGDPLLLLVCLYQLVSQPSPCRVTVCLGSLLTMKRSFAVDSFGQKSKCCMTEHSEQWPSWYSIGSVVSTLALSQVAQFVGVLLCADDDDITYLAITLLECVVTVTVRFLDITNVCYGTYFCPIFRFGFVFFHNKVL